MVLGGCRSFLVLVTTAGKKGALFDGLVPLSK